MLSDMPPSQNISPVELIGFLEDEFGGTFHKTAQYFNTLQENKTFWYGKEGNMGYPSLLGEKNVGHEFHLSGNTYTRPPIHVGEIWRGGPNKNRFNGALCPNPLIFPSGIGSLNKPDAWGAEAYHKMKPTKPSFAGLNALYELKDLPGMLRQRFSPSLMGASNYWLALQFGWKPLLSDIRNTIRVQLNGQQRLAQLLKDNGRPVRRRISLFDTISTPVITDGTAYGALQPVLDTFYYQGQPKYRYSSFTRDRVWASARFRYWLPEGPRDIAWKRRMLGRIFGLNPTPSVVYNAVPWSWLIDWFTNFGDCLSNMEAGVADRLAADYYYIMRHKESVGKTDVLGLFKDRNGLTVKAAGTATFTYFDKYRTRGDPFGFNTSANTLTGMQLSILGALGMSRLR